MTQRFYVDQNGNYLGSYDGPDESIPEIFSGTTIVPSAPENASQKSAFAELVTITGVKMRPRCS